MDFVNFKTQINLELGQPLDEQIVLAFEQEQGVAMFGAIIAPTAMDYLQSKLLAKVEFIFWNGLRIGQVNFSDANSVKLRCFDVPPTLPSSCEKFNLS
jgi:hypothetical protein